MIYCKILLLLLSLCILPEKLWLLSNMPIKKSGFFFFWAVSSKVWRKSQIGWFLTCFPIWRFRTWVSCNIYGCCVWGLQWNTIFITLDIIITTWCFNFSLVEPFIAISMGIVWVNCMPLFPWLVFLSSTSFSFPWIPPISSFLYFALACFLSFFVSTLLQ